jgi:hypothetical protein
MAARRDAAQALVLYMWSVGLLLRASAQLATATGRCASLTLSPLLSLSIYLSIYLYLYL